MIVEHEICSFLYYIMSYFSFQYSSLFRCYDEESIIQLKDIKINEKFINPGIISTISTSSSTTTTISSNTSDKVENRE